MPETKDKVIFRVYPEGDVIAIFPEIPGTYNPGTCSCYQHIGQHGAGDVSGMIAATRPAQPAEYAPLLSELQSIGYDLKVCKHRSRAMDQRRYQGLKLR